MTVYDKAGSLEYGVYTEPLGEIEWEISDSTKNVLGYDCVMATANYHDSNLWKLHQWLFVVTVIS